jgi:hypothetical protein
VSYLLTTLHPSPLPPRRLTSPPHLAASPPLVPPQDLSVSSIVSSTISPDGSWIVYSTLDSTVLLETAVVDEEVTVLCPRPLP